MLEAEDDRGLAPPPSTSTETSGRPDERLDSWKEIAAYLNRGARTVQRWEQEEGLPVHRLRHDKRGSVYAYKSELDAWWNSRPMKTEERPEDALPLAEAEASSSAEPAQTSRRYLYAAVSILLVAVAGFATWRVRLPTAQAIPSPRVVPLTSYPGIEAWPAFSPDGKKITFTWDGDRYENVDVYVKQLGSDQASRLTTDPRPDFNPVWSPDGSQIAFLRTGLRAKDSIYVVPSGGGPERKVAEINSLRVDLPDPYLTWCRNGRSLIVTERQSTAEPLGLVRVSVDNGEKRKLTVPPAQSLGDSAPAVSPDGATLAFVRCSTIRVCDLYLMDLFPDSAAKSAPRRLTHESTGINSPNWSADGQHLYFLKAPGDIATLWRVSVSGAKQPVPVSSIGDPGMQIALSPAGSTLAVAQATYDRNIYRYELNDRGQITGERRRLTNSTRSDHSPFISPDGKRLAFLSYRSGSSEIWVSDADGSNPRQLTFWSGPQVTSPRWSPDSSTIAFDARAEGNAEIYVVNPAGGKPRRLTTSSANDSFPSWSHDGKWIYFSSDRSGEMQIWKMPADGGEAAQITFQGGNGALESPDGEFVYYAKSYGYSETSLWRVPSSGGQEQKVLDSIWSYYNFCVAHDGIYFTGAYVQEKGFPVSVYRFATGKVEVIWWAEGRIAVGLSVWPLARPRYIYYADWELPTGDLMLVENFR